MDPNKNSSTSSTGSLPPNFTNTSNSDTSGVSSNIPAPSLNSHITRKLPGTHRSEAPVSANMETPLAGISQSVTPYHSGDIVLASDASQHKSGGKKKFIIFGIIAIIILATCGIIMLVLNQNNSSPTNNSSSNTANTAVANLITPTTNLGKSWMHYATYITDGKEADEGLAGEYDEYTYYEGIDKASGEDLAERQTYFDKARQLFQTFYDAYTKSSSKNTELVKTLDIHKQRLDFISARQSTVQYGQDEVYQQIANLGSDTAYNMLIAPYTSTSYQDETLQSYNTKMVELITIYVNSYNLMASYGCLTDASICTNNIDANTALQTNMETVFTLENSISDIVYNNHNSYMQELWSIANKLEGTEK